MTCLSAFKAIAFSTFFSLDGRAKVNKHLDPPWREPFFTTSFSARRHWSVDALRYLYITECNHPQQLLPPGQLTYLRYQINHATKQGLIVLWVLRCCDAVTELIVWITVLQSFVNWRAMKRKFACRCAAMSCMPRSWSPPHVPREYICVAMLYQNASVKYP